MDDVVCQEFYCGECQHYISATLNMALNGVAEIECPNCGHKHRRNIKDGEITESGRYKGEITQEICPVLCYEKPRTHHMKKAAKEWGYRRDGVQITTADRFLKDRWFEIHGAKK